MDWKQIFNGFQFHNYFIKTNKISNIFLFKRFFFINNGEFFFSFKRNSLQNKFFFQCFLVHFLQQPRSKVLMNFE